MELIIRRMRCEQCRKIHHELPDLLVPYKHYTSKSIEKVISAERAIDVGADESTLYRWRKWFSAWSSYAVGCLTSIGIRFQQDIPVQDASDPAQSALQKIGRYVGEQAGWLRRVVRSITNINLWIHTRSAFLSTVP